MPLAALAGNTVVAAAVTDAWEAARKGFARLLGGGNPDKIKLAERRLAETHDRLAEAKGADVERVRASLQAQWVTRMADLLEEDPAAEADLRTLVEQIRAQLPAGVPAADHSVAAGRDVHIAASGGGVAAGVIHGDVTAVQQLPEQRATAGQPVRLAPRPPMLAGREALLGELDALLVAGAGLVPCTVTLSGLGGAGKTSVAVEYAYRHLAEVGVAWQFPAEDVTVLAAGFGELAAQLGERGQADTRDPVASVHAVLAKFPAPWLVIFDNAADLAPLAAFLPPAGPGRVLITSRNPAWPGQVLEVPVLDRDVAAGFLVNRTGDADQPAAWDLAGELGGLPLALEQAAAYVQATGGTMAGYLSSFRQRRADVLARGEPTGYDKTVATTWAVAFGRLQQAAPGAAGLLRLLAFCAPEAIPLRLLLQPRPDLAGQLGEQVAPVLVPLLEDEMAAGDAVAALRRYSLVTPAADGSVSVHRLVQAVTADQMPVELASQWRQAAAALIEGAIPGDPELPKTWLICAALLPHAQAALNLTSRGMWRIALYVGYSGSYLAAQNLFRQIADAHSDDDGYGPEHPDTLVARSYLARWTANAGDAAGARDQCTALLPILERVLGAEHLQTLIARRNLGYYTGEAGDAAGARDQLAALLLILEPVLRQKHQATMITRRQLARFTGEAGDAAGARHQLAELLPTTEQELGPEHPDTLDTRADIAYWTGQAGDAAAARDQYAALLPVLERVLGPEHPDTLAARTSLADATGEAGDAAGARHQLAALLPILQRVLGPEHPNTLITRGNLAHWTGDAGDPAAARDLYAALLPVRERVLGADHPATLTVRDNLARMTGLAGDAAAAWGRYAALLPELEERLGPEHPDTLTARHELAYWTGRAGDQAAARDQFAALLPVAERVLGPDHPDTLRDRSHLAYWTGRAGDAAAARDQTAALLPELEERLGPEHPDTLGDHGNLAYWTGRAGDAAAARDQFAALLPIAERVSGREHPDTLTVRSNLAYWTGRAGDAAAARDQFAALLPVRERVLGPEHPDTLATWHSLARWTGEAGDAAAARDLFAALLPVRERVSGPEHPDTLTARSALATWTETAEYGPGGE